MKVFLIFNILFVFVTAIFAKDNVLLITIDTLRQDRLSIYNDKFVMTPNIDRIGKKGVIFTRAFAHTPMTLPSHTNIFTGTTPLYHGVIDNTGFKLNKKFLTMAEHLKKYNYSTAAFVASYILSKDFEINQGFDYYKEPVEESTSIAEEVIDSAISWLKKCSSPWFCWVHLWDPHSPYSPPEPYRKKFKHDFYSGEVKYVDDQLERLFDFLEKNNLYKDTILIITGDHGEGFGEHKEYGHAYFAYNTTILIPLIIYKYGMSHSRVKNNVCHIDIFPTVCDFLKIPVPKHLRGQSLLPLINGNDMKENNIYIESKGPYNINGWAPLEGYIYKNRKYIKLPIPELYDLNEDINENRNVISKVKLSELNGHLRELKNVLSGKDARLAKKKMGQREARKLRALGYLGGSVQEKKEVFSKEDDLKVLIPIHNMVSNALNLLEIMKDEEAIELFKKVLEKKPNYVAVYFNLSDTYKKIGKIDLAVNILKEGLKIKPNNIELKQKLGIKLIDAAKIDDAITVLEGVLKVEDSNPETWNHLSNAYFKKGRIKEAFKALDRALSYDPKFALAYNNRAVFCLTLYIQRKDMKLLKDALDYFNRAIELEPKFARAFNARGAAHKFNNNTDLALKDWKKAIKLEPELFDGYFNIAVTCIQKRDKSEALKYLKILRDRYYKYLPVSDQRRLARLLLSVQ